MDNDHDDCGCSPKREKKILFEDANEDFWKGYFFGVMYGMVLSAVILLR